MPHADPDPWRSLNHEFLATVKRHGNQVAFERVAADQEQPITHHGLGERALSFAAGLTALGLTGRSRVAIIADNCLNWYVADRGTLLAGGITVPQPADLGEQALRRVLRHSGSRIAVVERADHRQRIHRWSQEGRLPRLRHLVHLHPDADHAPEATLPEWTFEDVEQRGQKQLVSDREAVRAVALACRPESLATIVYTSGTTGVPKGVVLTHGNILHNIRVIPGVLDLRPDDRYLSILPAWHMFERTLEYILLHVGATVIYTSKRRIKKDLTRAHPTITAVVPRILEMIYQEIQKKITAAPPFSRRLAGFAIAVARQHAHALRHSRGVSDAAVARNAFFPRLRAHAVRAALAMPHRLLDRLVLRKFRQALGPTMRLAVSGGGALPLHIDEFLNAVGFTTLVGYGLTETAPVVSVRTVDRNPLGTIGPVLPETEVAVRDDTGAHLPADRAGLIFLRGPQVMRGYFRDRSLTRSVLSPDGWFNTGDLGSVRVDGEVRITGRAKDTIVLRNGENVDPMALEISILKSPYIEQVVLVGQDRKELGALVVPDPEMLARFAAERGVPGEDLATWVAHHDVQSLLRDEVQSRTTAREGFQPHEAVRRIHVLAASFSVEDGTMTHTLKVRRNVVLERYAGLVFGEG